jgi:NAD(P)-dependent dehydrogenase (short-subunit alcohol dehydrogenase family)
MARAIVIGGSSGIGLAVAERLTAAGTEVTVTGRDPAKLEAIGQRVAGAERLDATIGPDVADFFERTGAFEHLVLAAGPGATGIGTLGDVSEASVRAAFDGKLIAYLTALRHAQVTETVTMVSSVGARAARSGTAVLAAVNGGIERMVPPLAAELAPVRVNAVSPGTIDTAWWSFLPDDERRALMDEVARSVPLKRNGRAEEIADAVAYLIAAEFVTGVVLPVDGGYSMSA